MQPKQLADITFLALAALASLSIVSGAAPPAMDSMEMPEVDLVPVAGARSASVTVKKELASTSTESLLELAGLDAASWPQETPGGASSDSSFNEEQLLPKSHSLFHQDAVDVGALLKMDCHLRNVDYCYAGMLASAGKALPETDSELESRCDETRVATSCMALYNERCGTFKVFSALAPMAGGNAFEMVMDQSGPAGDIGKMLNEAHLPPALESLLMNQNQSINGFEGFLNLLTSEQEQALNGVRLRPSDLMSVCEPAAKGTKANRLIRLRLFQLSKCINQRMPLLRPCFEDLKGALQLFYEPGRVLPMQPTCCAMSRFKNCAGLALENICGLSSLESLLAALPGGSEDKNSPSTGPGGMFRTVERVCRGAHKLNSPYCNEVLPPSGLKVPQRRGQKASKLARALDLISFSPAVQT